MYGKNSGCGGPGLDSRHGRSGLESGCGRSGLAVVCFLAGTFVKLMSVNIDQIGFPRGCQVISCLMLQQVSRHLHLLLAPPLK